MLLLPVYTGRIAPAGYGIVETLATFVIFASIVDPLRDDRVVPAVLLRRRATGRAQDALVRRSMLFLIGDHDRRLRRCS